MIEGAIFGNVLSAGGNLSRLTALQSGLSKNIPRLTVDRQCGSGINAVNITAQAIRAGAGDGYIAGGTESMTRAPYLMNRPERPNSPTPPSFCKSRLSPDFIGDPPVGLLTCI